MNAFLMYRDRDFDLKDEAAPNAAESAQDLEFDTLFRAMAGGDEFLLAVARRAVLNPLQEPEAILYRRHILADCLDRAGVVRELYGIAVEAIERERKIWGWMSARYPEGTLHRAIEVMHIFVELLKKLHRIAEEHAAEFRSEGFQRLFAMFAAELDDRYMSAVEQHLQRLDFPDGIVMSAELGPGNKGVHYVLRRPAETNLSWTERLQNWVGQLAGRDGSSLVYEIADRDESGFRALADLRAQGVAHVARALAQSADHILGFFGRLRTELGFYIGCLNLGDRLARKGEPICLPEPRDAGCPRLSARGLYDVCLSLNLEEKTIGNDLDADGKTLVVITGANRGGKSTFLRSAGLAQWMMQCGMFVAAEHFRASVCPGIFTHFKREEDAGMRSGKLDEELARMSTIVDRIAPHSMVLLNESFASTNEREGSEIARQIVRSLLESGMKVLYVTHMYGLADGFHRAKMDGALFLRAERLPDGARTFRVKEGEPLPTSFGRDLYDRIFAAPGGGAPSGQNPAT
jgi:MutS domain V